MIFLMWHRTVCSENIALFELACTDAIQFTGFYYMALYFHLPSLPNRLTEKKNISFQNVFYCPWCFQTPAVAAPLPEVPGLPNTSPLAP